MADDDEKKPAAQRGIPAQPDEVVEVVGTRTLFATSVSIWDEQRVFLQDVSWKARSNSSKLLRLIIDEWMQDYRRDGGEEFVKALEKRLKERG